MTLAAHGTYTTHGMPDGSTSLTPHIVVASASRALEFYSRVFGATVRDVTRAGDLVAHAVLAFPSGNLTLSDALPSYELIAPSKAGPVVYSLALYVSDCDEVVARAVEAGATVREPPTTFVSGDRFASIRDPFGVRWSVMTRVEDLSFEESAARVAKWAKEAMGG
ncbi:MAG TPA: VOC family protein [Polyangiales bacterium]|nr:VOC family protein [Polyangiales bacterium]